MAGNSADSEAIDTLLQASTPEGLKFVLRLAGPYPRALAFAFDTLIQGVLIFLVAMLITLVLQHAMWLLLLMVFLVQWFYSALFEAFNHGRTPGKMLLGLQVVHVDGSAPDFSLLILRNLLRAADMFFFCFLLGLIVMGMSPLFQRLGDLAAGTVVIHKPRRLVHAGHHVPAPGIVPIPAPIKLTAVQTQAIIAFAQRCPQFSSARARDLAQTAIVGLYGEAAEFADPVVQLQSIAAWLSGYRQTVKPESTLSGSLS